MKARDLQVAFYRATWQRYQMVAPNIHLDWKFNEMDLFGLRKSGFVDEIEIKLSRSDYLADFKKRVKPDGKWETINREINGIDLSYQRPLEMLKHDALKEGLNYCNYFSFLMPEELAEKCDIPEYAGLYIYRIGRDGKPSVYEVKTAPRLHKCKLSEQFKFEVGRKMAYRYWNMECKS